MSFWNNLNAAPIQSHHFTVEFGGGVKLGPGSHEVKSVTLPTLETDEGSYRMGNHVYKYPGQQRWGDVVITVVDSGEALRGLMARLNVQGYSWTSSGAQTKGREDVTSIVIRQNFNKLKVLTKPEKDKEEKKGFLAFLGFTKKEKGGPPYSMVGEGGGGFIYGYNSWTLKGAWIKSVNFGTHDYSSDELLSMEITVTYDYPEITFWPNNQAPNISLGGASFQGDEIPLEDFEAADAASDG